ncbi:MAG: peptidase T [Candidatus Heimdallarchaeota archaeon]|nr:peptidase T [Candidatus Heimdallarchaeota archaeon]
MQSDVVERFLRYVTIHTTSKEDVKAIPSTERQFDLAKILVDELHEIGITDAIVNKNCYVIGTLPSNLSLEMTKKRVPVLCFLAHLDTSPESPGKNVKPQIIKNYSGGDIKFPADPDLIISADETPSLKKFIGGDIITSDGTTLLGGDDKAGIASIMAALSILTSNPDLRHGTIKIVFTPDEEVGRGVDALDVKSLEADFGYTMDGDEMGALESETFNAAGGTVKVKGFNCHPGYAKDKLVNAILILSEIVQYFPTQEAPETTELKEGYYHIYEFSGTVNEAKAKFIIRDFDYDELKIKIEKVKSFVEKARLKFPKASIVLDVKESYKNMKYKIDDVPEVMVNAEEAIKRTGIPVIKKAIRGGTDGARLSYMGLPTPNIFAGAMNFHSTKEFVPVMALEKSVETIINLVQIFVEKAEM